MPDMGREPRRNGQPREDRTTAETLVREVITVIRRTHVILLQKLLRVVVAVDIDLGNSIEYCCILTASLNAGFKPGEDQLQPVPLLNFGDKLIDRESALNAGKQALDGDFVAVNVQETTNNLRCPGGVDALNVYFDELGEAILVQI
jgi:hypothetical protein